MIPLRIIDTHAGDCLLYQQHYAHLDMPIGNAFGGPLSGKRDMPFLAIPIAAGIAAAAGAVGIGISAGVAMAVAYVAVGLTVVSVATTVAGAITGNETLMSIGKWTGVAGGVIGGVASLGTAAAELGVAGAAAGADSVNAAASGSAAAAGSAAVGNTAETALGNAAKSSITPVFQSSSGQSINSATEAASSGLSNAAKNSLSSAMTPNFSSLQNSTTLQSFVPDSINTLGSDASQGIMKYGSSDALKQASGNSLSDTSKIGLNAENVGLNKNASGGLIDSFKQDAVNNLSDSARTNFSSTLSNNGGVDAVGNNVGSNVGSTVGKTGSDTGLFGDLFNTIEKYPTTSKATLEAISGGAKYLAPNRNAEAQAQLLAAQKNLNDAQKRALLREMRWQQGLSTGSFYAPG